MMKETPYKERSEMKPESAQRNPLCTREKIPLNEKTGRIRSFSESSVVYCII